MKYELFANLYRTNVSFVKIGSVRLVLHFRASVTLYPCFPHLLSSLDEFQH